MPPLRWHFYFSSLLHYAFAYAIIDAAITLSPPFRFHAALFCHAIDTARCCQMEQRRDTRLPAPCRCLPLARASCRRFFIFFSLLLLPTLPCQFDAFAARGAMMLIRLRRCLLLLHA